MEDFNKLNADKKTVLNIPVSLDLGKKRGSYDEDFMVEAIEKLRDYMTSEFKRL